MCSRPGAALCVGGGTLLLLSMQHYASHHGSRQARPFHGEAHQQVEVDSSLKTLRGLAPTVRGGRPTIGQLPRPWAVGLWGAMTHSL